MRTNWAARWRWIRRDNIYVTGDTDSGNGSTAVFPTKTALDGTYGGGTCVNSGNTNVPCTDAFIAAYGSSYNAGLHDRGYGSHAVSPGEQQHFYR